MAYPFGETPESNIADQSFEEFEKELALGGVTKPTVEDSLTRVDETDYSNLTFEEFEKSINEKQSATAQPQPPSPAMSGDMLDQAGSFEEFENYINNQSKQPSMQSMDVQPQVAPQQSEAARVKELSLYGGESGQTESSWARRLIADPAIALLGKGVVGLGQGAVGLANLIPVPVSDRRGGTKWSFGEAGKALERLGVDFKTTQEIFDATLSPEARAAWRNVSEAEGFTGKAKAMVQNPSTIVLSAIESIPSMLGGAAIGRKVLTTGARIAANSPKVMTLARSLMAKNPALPGIVAAAIGEGAISAGSQAEQVRKTGEGITGKQAGLSAGGGVATSILGLIGGKAASYLGVDDLDILFTTWQPNLKKVGILFKAVKGMLTEGGEELPQSVSEQIFNNLSEGRPWNEGLKEAGAQGLLAGGFTGVAANTITGALGRDTTTPPPPAQKTSAQINQEKVREQTGKVRQTEEAIQDDNVTTDDLDKTLDEALSEFQAMPLETEAPVAPVEPVLPTPQVSIEDGTAPQTNPVLATPENPVLISNPPAQAAQPEIQPVVPTVEGQGIQKAEVADRDHPNYRAYRQANMTDEQAMAMVERDVARANEVKAIPDEQIRDSVEYLGYRQAGMRDADALAEARNDLTDIQPQVAEQAQAQVEAPIPAIPEAQPIQEQQPQGVPSVPRQVDSTREGTSQAVPQGEGGGQVVSQPRELSSLPEVQTVQAQEDGAVRGVEQAAPQVPVEQATQIPTQATATPPTTKQVNEGMLREQKKKEVPVQAPVPPAPPVAATPTAAPVPVETTSAPSGKKISVPLPPKKEAAITPKEQKKYFIAEIDKAIADASDDPMTVPNIRKYDSDNSIRGKNASAFKSNMDKFGTVTIEVPGDGTFNVLNSKQALNNLKERVNSMFPAKEPKASAPSISTAKPSLIAKTEKRPASAVKTEWDKLLDPFASKDKERKILEKPSYFSDKKEVVSTDSRRLVVATGVNTGSKPIVGYPNHAAVIPGYRAGKMPELIENQKEISISDTEKLLRQIRQAGIATNENKKDATVGFYKMPDGSVSVVSIGANGESDNGYVSSPVEDGELIGVYNAGFIDEAITFFRKSGNEKITFRWTDDTSPILLLGEKEYVIQMPIRGSGETDIDLIRGIVPSKSAVKKTRLSIPSSTLSRQSQEELSKTLQKRIGKNADVRVNDDGTIDIVSKTNQTVINVRPMSPSQDGVAGKWSQEGGRNTIHIAENGEISHELTHAMRDLGMITNNEWSRLVALSKKSVGANAESIRTRYKDAGVELSEGDLDHELVASYINDVANGKIDPAANRALTQKVIDFFRELARTIGYGVGSDVGVVGRTVEGRGISSATKTDSNVGRMSIPAKPTGMFQDIAASRVEQNEESGKWEIRDDRNVIRSGFNTEAGAKTYKDVLSGKYDAASVRAYTDKNGDTKYGILMNGELGVEPERMEKARWFKKGFASQEEAAMELAQRESRMMDSVSNLMENDVKAVAQVADARKNLVDALLGQNVERAQINDLLGTLFKKMKIAPATQMKIVKQMKNVSLSAIKKNPASAIQKAWDFVDNVVMQSYAEEKANVEHKSAVRGFKKALSAIKKIGLSEENIERKKSVLDGIDMDKPEDSDISAIIEEFRKDTTIEKSPEDLEFLDSLTKKRRIADMSADEINYIAENLNLIRKDQVELRKSINNAYEEKTHKDSKQVIEEQKFDPYKREPIKRGNLLKEYLSFFLPSRTVARLIDGKKDGIIHKYFVDAFRKAENVSYQIMSDARDLVNRVVGDFDVNKMSRPTEQNKIPKKQQGTPTEYVLDSPYVEYNKDGTVKKSTEQKISLFDGEKVAIALAGRNEANRKHMREGGIVIPDLTHMDAIKLTDADIDRITQDVENDPQLKKIADAYDELFNTLLKSYLNETSMKLHGIKIADVENYFPIIVSKAHAMFKDIDWENPDPLQVSNLHRFVIESIGAFKARIPNAKNAVVLYDVFKMGDRAITLTGLYSGYAEPIANVKRLMRTEFKRMQDGELRRIGSVPDAIKQQHGEAMWDRISSLAGEVEKTRNVKNRDDNFLSKALNVWTRGALAWNLPVILTQPVSYMQALAEMPMKYWTKAIATRPASWAEMGKYSPRLLMRADGRISLAVGAVRGMSTRGMGEAGMKPITEFDRQAVGRIWNGVKMMIKDRNPDATQEEILKMTAEETERVVELTQSTFEQSSRSAAQRSNSMFWKTAMRFSSQNTKNFDMLVNAALDFGEDKSLKSFTKMAQKLSVLFAAQVAYAILKTGVARKLMRRGDEEEDEKYFNETLVSSLASLGGIGTEIMLRMLNASRYQGGRGDPFYDAITQSGGLVKDAVTGMWKAKTGTPEERKKADKSLVNISEAALRQLGVMTGTGFHSMVEPGLAVLRHMDAEKKRFDAVKTGIQNNAASYAPAPYKPTVYKP